MTLSVKQEPEWMQVLRADVAATGSIQKTADRVGMARSGLSAILNNTASSPYANGKSTTAKVAERVMNTIGLVACPFLSEYHGTEQRITGLKCREYAYRENPPTGAPREMQHWRACQGCDKRVKAAASPQPAPAKQETRQQRVAFNGKATSGDEAYQEGWDCIGGPNDNPYPVEDSRSDYWETGYRQRRESDRKRRARLNEIAGVAEQQAGIIDKVTMPLPEVGGPQVEATL